MNKIKNLWESVSERKGSRVKVAHQLVQPPIANHSISQRRMHTAVFAPPPPPVLVKKNLLRKKCRNSVNITGNDRSDPPEFPLHARKFTIQPKRITPIYTLIITARTLPCSIG